MGQYLEAIAIAFIWFTIGYGICEYRWLKKYHELITEAVKIKHLVGLLEPQIKGRPKEGSDGAKDRR